MLRALAICAASLSITLATAQPIDKWIEDLESGNEQARIALMNGPKTVDARIVSRLRAIASSSEKPDIEKTSRLINVLVHRWNFAETGDIGLEGVEVLFRLKPLIGNASYTDSYFHQRGPEFYHYLLRLAKSRSEDRAQALELLRTTAVSLHRQGKSDPALVRLFRRERDYISLAYLGDKSILPTVRRDLQGSDLERRKVAMGAAYILRDPESTPLILPRLLDADEVEAGRKPDKFGPAYWTLRQTIRPEHADLLLAFVEEHPDYPRSFAINLLGYVGTSKHAAAIKPFTDDPHWRVKLAAINANQRIEGKLVALDFGSAGGLPAH